MEQNRKIIDGINRWKIELISLIVAFICLLLSATFPLENIYQIVLRAPFFLVVLPILFIKLVLKKPLSGFGLNLAGHSRGALWATISLLSSLVISLGLFYFFELEKKYFVPVFVINNFWAFVFYELVIINLILFIISFFFHGFIQATLSEKLGLAAPFLQFLVFLIFLSLTGNLAWQYAPLIIVAFCNGIATYKSRSFIYSYISSLFFILFLDLYIVELLK